MPHIRTNINSNMAGFSISNAKKGEQVQVLTKATFNSDQTEFYEYVEKISDIFLAKVGLFIDGVSQFLVLIHKDLSVDIYVNDFPVIAEMKMKKSIQKGQAVSINDIADISYVKFEGIDIKEDDKIIYCSKIWRKFGLYFDFNHTWKIEIDKLQREIGSMYRYLQFQYVYKVLENEGMFEELQKDGWFPFIEIIGQSYKELINMYTNKFNFESNIKAFIDSFDERRIKEISWKWRSNEEFNNKKWLIGAGLDAYYKNDKNGFINCIKTLASEVEGIIRLHYFSETHQSKAKFKELINHIIEKGKLKGSSDWLLFPIHFLSYLEKIFFADFNLNDERIELSRHSSGHGVAKEEDYNKIKALQTILVLDQLFFYLN